MSPPDDLIEVTCELFGLQRTASEGSSATIGDPLRPNELLTFELRFAKPGVPFQAARRLSPGHLELLRTRHWLLGVSSNDDDRARYYLHGTPRAMEPWLESMARRLGRDQLLVERAAARLDLDDLHALCGEQRSYTYGDLQNLIPGKVPDRNATLTADEALGLLRERCMSLLQRGTEPTRLTIPNRYFDGWERIVDRHAARLQDRLLAQRDRFDR